MIRGVSTRFGFMGEADGVFAACHILLLAAHFSGVGAGRGAPGAHEQYPVFIASRRHDLFGESNDASPSFHRPLWLSGSLDFDRLPGR